MILAVISLTDVPVLSPWRATAGLEGCVSEEHLWLRLADDMAQAVRWATWPAVERYRWQGPATDGVLIPHSGTGRPTATLPVRRAPVGPWVPFSELWPALAPRFAFGGTVHGLGRITVALIPSSAEQPMVALQLPLADVIQWAERAPLVRLARLHFAASSHGHVLVTGSPLPPLMGQPWWAPHPALWLPAGQALAPWLRPEWVTAAAGLIESGLNGQRSVVLCGDGHGVVIPGEAFLPLTRAALRATRDALTSPEADFLSSLPPLR